MIRSLRVATVIVIGGMLFTHSRPPVAEAAGDSSSAKLAHVACPAGKHPVCGRAGRAPGNKLWVATVMPGS